MMKIIVSLATVAAVFAGDPCTLQKNCDECAGIVITENVPKFMAPYTCGWCPSESLCKVVLPDDTCEDGLPAREKCLDGGLGDPCSLVKCMDVQKCPNNAAPIKHDGECCATCPPIDPCSLVMCVSDTDKMQCPPGQVAAKDPDDCCATCVDDCSLVDCLQIDKCPNGDVPAQLPGECCPSCPCDDAVCAIPSCMPGSVLVSVPPPPGAEPACCPEYICNECGLLDCIQDLDQMRCEYGWVPFKHPDECCAICTRDCTLVRCAGPDALQCPTGQQVQAPLPGECCASCVPICGDVACPSRPECPAGSLLTVLPTPAGEEPQCCPVYACDDCAMLDCIQDPNELNCPAGEVAIKHDGDCCAVCRPSCELVTCPQPEMCPGGADPIPKDGECCASCPDACDNEKCAPRPFCPKGSILITETNPAECCPVYKCSECASLDCIQDPAEMKCGPGSAAFKGPNQCCASCRKVDCSLVLCKSPRDMQCPGGANPELKDGDCCHSCPTIDPCALVMCVSDAAEMECSDAKDASLTEGTCCATCKPPVDPINTASTSKVSTLVGLVALSVSMLLA